MTDSSQSTIRICIVENHNPGPAIAVDRHHQTVRRGGSDWTRPGCDIGMRSRYETRLDAGDTLIASRHVRHRVEEETAIESASLALHTFPN